MCLQTWNIDLTIVELDAIESQGLQTRDRLDTQSNGSSHPLPTYRCAIRFPSVSLGSSHEGPSVLADQQLVL